MSNEVEQKSLEALYDEYFAVIPADTDSLRLQAYKLRYQVYCIEQEFQPPDEQLGDIEMDEHDEHSVHAVLIFKPTERVVGCVRLVLPTDQAPISSFPIYHLLPSNLQQRLQECPPEKTAEISRYAVSKVFRRREGESLYPDIGFFELEERDSRRLAPHISLGLLRGVGKLAFDNGITHVCAAMAPALLRLLGKFGLRFDLLGSPIEYHGLRQPCIAECETLLTDLSKQNADYFKLVEAAYRHGRVSENPLGKES